MPVSLLRAITALLLVSFATLSVPAQQTKPSPDEKQRKIKRELKKAYVEWINDVDLILTAGQRLTLTRLIDSRNLEPGKYQIQIRIRDHVSGQTITPEASFTVEP